MNWKTFFQKEYASLLNTVKVVKFEVKTPKSFVLDDFNLDLPEI